MRDPRTLFFSLCAALALVASGCGGGGGGSGGDGQPPPLLPVTDRDGDGVPNEDDAFPDDPARFAAFREVRLPSLAPNATAYAVAVSDEASPQGPRVAGMAVSDTGVLRAVTWVAQEGASAPIALGTDPTQESAAYGVDDLGLVVGEAAVGGASQAVYWLGAAQPPTPLSMAGMLAGGRSAALAVNNLGQVAGEAEKAADTFVPVVWSNLGADPVELSAAPGAAYFLSDTGWVVGEAGGEAVYWTEDAPGAFGGPFPLPLLAGDTRGAALGVDSGGRIVGESEAPDGLVRAVLWQRNETGTAWLATDLGPVSVQAINDSHRVAGYGGGPDPASRAAVWDTRLTDPTASDPVVDGDTFGQAYGMNQGGVIVGAAAGAAGSIEAFAALPE